MPWYKKSILSILAGMAIALGGIVFWGIKSVGTQVYWNVIASYAFSIGLILVLVFGLWLFTGKIAYAIERKFSVWEYLLMFVGNLFGALAVGYLAFGILRNTPLFSINETTVQSKLENFRFWDLFFSGMFCGMFVYAAVESYKIKKWVLGIRILLVIGLIGTFVYLKLNHCIANIFYFAFANVWSGKAVLFIFVNTLANSVGAILLNGLKLLVLLMIRKNAKKSVK